MQALLRKYEKIERLHSKHIPEKHLFFSVTDKKDRIGIIYINQRSYRLIVPLTPNKTTVKIFPGNKDGDEHVLFGLMEKSNSVRLYAFSLKTLKAVLIDRYALSFSGHLIFKFKDLLHVRNIATRKTEMYQALKDHQVSFSAVGSGRMRVYCNKYSPVYERHMDHDLRLLTDQPALI